MKLILSEGPRVFEMKASELIGRFPALKADYSLQKPYNRKKFGSFWSMLRAGKESMPHRQ